MEPVATTQGGGPEDPLADSNPIEPTRLLIVEHNAGSRQGHYMKELEANASALHRDRHEVHVLSSAPLAIEAEGRRLENVTVHLVAPRWARPDNLGQRLIDIA